jgi:hypothetical protein
MRGGGSKGSTAARAKRSRAAKRSACDSTTAFAPTVGKPYEGELHVRFDEGRWKRATGLLDRDTRPKGEKRSGVAGPHAVLRHCSTLQKRNVTEALPERMRTPVRSAMSQAYTTRDPKRDRGLLENLARRLQSQYPGAAVSLRERLEETLTVMRLGPAGESRAGAVVDQSYRKSV